MHAQELNLKNIEQFVATHPEFKIYEKPHGYTVDYNYVLPTSFDEPMARELRGLKLCREGKLLYRPLHKFFNHGERGSSLNLTVDTIIQDKIDGSMVHPFFHDNRFAGFMTRAGETDVALKATAYYQANPVDRPYGLFCERFWRMGLLPIFEYVGPYNRVVLDYAENIILLTMREQKYGKYMSCRDVDYYALEYDLPVANWSFANDLSVDSFVKSARAVKNLEGYVVRQGDEWIKIKADEYLNLHKLQDSLIFAHKRLAVILDGNVDDILARRDMPELRRENDFFLRGLRLCVEITKGAVLLYKGDKKDFYLNILPKFPPFLHHAILQSLSNDAHSCVTEIFRRATVNQTKYRELEKCLLTLIPPLPELTI